MMTLSSAQYIAEVKKLKNGVKNVKENKFLNSAQSITFKLTGKSDASQQLKELHESITFFLFFVSFLRQLSPFPIFNY
jgi:hypothetical protein